MPDPLALVPSRYDHPDAVAMTERAQTYYREIYGGEDTNPITPGEFVLPHGEFLIGYLDGEAVVMGGWRLLPVASPIPAERPGELRRMFVDPGRRRLGLGLGLRLLAGLEASARRCGVDVLLLETGRPQTGALALYRAAGYVDVPAFGYWAGSDVAVHLGRRLGPGGGSG